MLVLMIINGTPPQEVRPRQILAQPHPLGSFGDLSWIRNYNNNTGPVVVGTIRPTFNTNPRPGIPRRPIRRIGEGEMNQLQKEK